MTKVLPHIVVHYEWQHIYSVQTCSLRQAARALKIQNLLAIIARLYGVPTFTDQYRDFCTQVQHIQQDAAQIREVLFREVLQWSRRLIVDCQLDYCPVCRREIERDSLVASLEERVRQAAEIAETITHAQRSKAALVGQIQEEIGQVDALMGESSSFGIITDSQTFAHYHEWLSAIVTRLTPEPIDVDLEQLTELAETPHAAGFVASLAAPSDALRTENNRLQSTDGDRQAIAVIDLLSQVTESYSRLSLLLPQQVAKRSTYDEMAAVYDCFVSSKKTQVQGVYDELEADIARFFKDLHKDEGYGDIKLAIQEDRRASTEIKVDFHQRQREDPRAFNSEGHLDSLGFCVFLAFVKRFNAGFPIIVLDDVVSSIDARHRANICELLFNEFDGYQLFITTHDYVWFDELTARQRACNKTHGFINMQILDWTLATGPRMARHKPRWERTDEKLANGDKDGAAADARKALENILLDVAISTGAPIALKADGKYTVGDLQAPCVARIKKLVPSVYETNQAVFGALDRHLFIGNLLVHNNPQAANASISEVRDLVDAVKSLEGLFTCPRCGRRVTYYRDAKVMKCHCGQVTWPAKD